MRNPTVSNKPHAYFKLFDDIANVCFHVNRSSEDQRALPSDVVGEILFFAGVSTYLNFASTNRLLRNLTDFEAYPGLALLFKNMMRVTKNFTELEDGQAQRFSQPFKVGVYKLLTMESSVNFSSRYNLVKNCNVRELQQRIAPMTGFSRDPCWNTRSARALKCFVSLVALLPPVLFILWATGNSSPVIYVCVAPGCFLLVCMASLIDHYIIDRCHNRQLLGSIRLLRHRVADDELVQQLLQETPLAPDKNLSQLCDQLEQGNNVFLFSSQQTSIAHEPYVNYAPL
jgi:hypothetical protein